MSISFTYPLAALLLLLVPALWFWPSRPRTAWHGVIRTLLFVLLIAALMQPVTVLEVEQERHVVVLDETDSMSAAARSRGSQAAAALVSELAGRGDATMIRLGADDAESPSGENAARRIVPGANDASPLARALEIAGQSIPRAQRGSVVLISDGLATSRDWAGAAAHLAERDIPVHVFDPGASSTDAFPARLRFAAARPGESLRGTAEVIGANAEMQLVLRSGEEELARSDPFRGEGRHYVEVDFEAGEPGFLDVTAELVVAADAGDDPGNNRLQAVAAIQTPLRILYLGSRQEGAADRLSGILGPGHEIDSADPGELGGDTDLDPYQLVMLDDVPARLLSEPFQARLEEAVVDSGLGLMMSGGEASFADGGYFGTPVADLLPVEITGEDDISDPSVGLALILDTSGSMGGTRIELAKQIARIAVRRLQPHDRIGIVEFYGAKHWAVPMQPASNKIEIDRAIGRMKAIGGTVLYPAIQEAYYGLKNINTRFKHIILVTDAGVEDANYEAMVRNISRDNINVSTILVGQGGHNLVMSDIANWGQGRFYGVGNQFSLVELILKRPTVRKAVRYKRGSFSLDSLSGPGWWGPVDPASLPPLNGYAQVEPRDQAEMLIRVADARYPVLSSWRYGLGRVTTLMTEPAGQGTDSWREWPDYAEFLGRVVARTASDQEPFKLELNRRGDTAQLSVRRYDNDPLLAPVARMVDEAGNESADTSPELIETAPGLFEADFHAAPEEAIRFVVRPSRGAGAQRIALAPYSDRFGETQVDPAAAIDLEELAALTGGAVLAGGDAAQIRAGGGLLTGDVTRLWPWLLLAALLAYLADIVYRRWPR